MNVYQLEDIRTFISRRQFLHRGESRDLVTEEEYRKLMERTLDLPPRRVSHLRSFIEGWKRAKL
jgi:hypothetical protein